MTKFRVIYNGSKYRIQKKSFFGWNDIKERSSGPNPILETLEFESKIKATDAIRNKYTIHPNILERKWEKTGWEWI